MHPLHAKKVMDWNSNNFSIHITTSIVIVKGLNATNLQLCLTDDEVAYSLLNNSLFYTTIYMILINALLNGIGISLSYTASLEFIIAQAPLQMQGLIIGFWYGRLIVYAIIKVVGSTILGCYLEFHLTISSIILSTLVALTISAWLYDHRQHNETSDVNVQSTIKWFMREN